MSIVYVMYDSGVTRFERECIKDALFDFKREFPGNDIINYRSRQWSIGRDSGADLSADLIVKKAMESSSSGKLSIDVDQLINTMQHSVRQKRYPHVEVLFTSYDLTVQGRICSGVTSGGVTVQSLCHYRNLPRSEHEAVIKKTLWCELGRMLGADGGCVNHNCAMRQGKDLDETISNAKDTVRHHKIFCSECIKRIMVGRR